MNRRMVAINKPLHNSMPMFLAATLLVSPLSVADAGGFIERPMAKNRIEDNSVNVTTRQFFENYISGSADERGRAKLYLLGVMDATEGKSWCDYRTFKSISLQDYIYSKLQELESHRLNERASRVIEGILSQSFPCRKVK